jgi:hypothetical protein
MPAPTPRNRTRPPRHSRPSRLYAGAIVAIAVFVVGAAVWRSPVTGFRAEAVVSYRTGPNDADTNTPSNSGHMTLPQISNEVRSPDAVRLAAEKVLYPKAEPAGEAPFEIGDSELADIQRRITTRESRDESKDVFWVTLAYEDPDRDDALELVNELAGQFVSRCNQDSETSKRQLSSQLEAAIKNTAAIRSRVDSLASRHEEASRREELSTASSDVSTTAPPDHGTAVLRPEGLPNAASSDLTIATDREQSLNLDWIQLRDHVAQLRNRQSVLSATRTEVHPEMLEVAAEIDEFSAILARTPKHVESEDFRGRESESDEAAPEMGLTLTFPLLANDPPGADFPEPNPAVSDGGVRERPATDIASTDRAENGEFPAKDTGGRPTNVTDHDEISELERQFETVHAESVRAERKERELQANIRLLGLPRAVVETPARTAVRVGGELSTTHLLQLLGTALALGAIAAIALPSSRAGRVVHRVGDAEDQLGIPAIGSLSRRDGVTKSAEKFSLRRGAVRLITSAAEYSLIAVVVFFLTAMLLDRSLFPVFIDDPLHAFHQTLDLAKNRLAGG